MKIRLYSYGTYFFKYLLPLLLLIASFKMITSIEYNFLTIAFLFFVVFFDCIIIYISLFKLCLIYYDSDRDQLIVYYFFKQMAIEKSQIERVRQVNFVNPLMAQITLNHKSVMGKDLVFIPRGVDLFVPFYTSTNGTVKQLQEWLNS